MAAEKRWDIVLEWYRGEIGEEEFTECFWSGFHDTKKCQIPSWDEARERRPLEHMDLEELRAELKFHRWGEEKFSYTGDQASEREDYILELIEGKKKEIVK